MKFQSERLQRAIPYGILFIFVVWVYFPLLSGTFLWDDQQFFLENRYLTSIHFASKWLTESMTSGAGIVSNFYRPLQLVTHFIDLTLWGAEPWGHRLSNLVLHLLASLALLAVVSRILEGRRRQAVIWPAFLAVSLYVLHPIQVEAVGYISGRGDILVLLWGCVGALALENRFWLGLWGVVLVPLLYFTQEGSQAWRGPILLYERILRFEPHSVKAMNNLAMHYDQETRQEEAEHLYRRAIAEEDIFAETHHNLALLYLKRKEDGPALEEFQKALTLNPQFFQAYTWMGHLFARQRQLARAREAYQSALKIFPDPEARRGLQALDGR